MRTLTLLSLLVATPALAGTRTILVDGPRLRLSDVVGVVANDADLGPAPQPGMLRRLPRGRLAAYLSPARLRRLPSFVNIRTRRQRLDCKTFQQRVRGALRDRIEAGLRIQSVDCRHALTLPRGPLNFSARVTGRRRAGRLFAAVQLRAGGWPAQSLIVPVVVDGSISVLIAARDLPTGHALSRQAVRVEQRRASEVSSDVLSAATSLALWEPRSPLREGTILRASRLQRVPLVRRGARVTLVVQARGVRLTGTAEVREDGAKGVTVRVLCLKTRKLVKARVAGPGRVVMDL